MKSSSGMGVGALGNAWTLVIGLPRTCAIVGRHVTKALLQRKVRRRWPEGFLLLDDCSRATGCAVYCSMMYLRVGAMVC